MNSKETEEHSRVCEQEIFTKAVFSYLQNYNVHINNPYNINFDHFSDFRSLYDHENYIRQNLSSVLTSKPKSIEFIMDYSTALDEVLTAKNNYQRIILQMLDTVYHQQRRLNYQSILLQLHNTLTSRFETHENNLKGYIQQLTSYPLEELRPFSLTSLASLNHDISTHNLSTKALLVKEPISLLHESNNTYNKPLVSRSSVTSNQMTTQASSVTEIQSHHKTNLCLDLISASNPSQKSTTCSSHRLYKLSIAPVLNTANQGKCISARSKNSYRYQGNNVVTTSRTTKRCSSSIRRNSEETVKKEHRDIISGNNKNQSTDKIAVKSKKVPRQHRHMSCELIDGSSDDRNNVNNTPREQEKPDCIERLETENVKMIKPLEISGMEERSSAYEYDSIEMQKVIADNMKLLNNMFKVDTTQKSNKKTDEVLVYDHDEEGAISVQDKSLSFQAGASQEGEISIEERPALKEYTKSIWPQGKVFGETLGAVGEIKEWDCIEKGTHLATSPNFGCQTMTFEEKSLDAKDLKINSERSRLDRSGERKENELNYIDRVYRGAGVLKKKKWVPLLSKKN